MQLNEKVIQFLKDQKVWTLATYGGGKAHCVPCYHTDVVDAQTLIVSVVFLRTTLKNIEENGQIALTAFRATPDGRFESYQVTGTAHFEGEGPLFERGKQLVGEKPLPYRGVLVIHVQDGTVCSPGPNVGKGFDTVQW